VRDGRGLLLHDRTRVGGAGAAWAAEAAAGMPHVATFVAARAAPTDWTALAADLGEAVGAAGPAVVGGATALGRGGVLVRVLAASAPDLTGLAATLWRTSRIALLGLLPPPLRKL